MEGCSPHCPATSLCARPTASRATSLKKSLRNRREDWLATDFEVGCCESSFGHFAFVGESHTTLHYLLLRLTSNGVDLRSNSLQPNPTSTPGHADPQSAASKGVPGLQPMV